MLSQKSPAVTSPRAVDLARLQAALSAMQKQAEAAEHLRAVYALDSTIPDVMPQQILAWLNSRENP